MDHLERYEYVLVMDEVNLKCVGISYRLGATDEEKEVAHKALAKVKTAMKEL